MQATTTVHARPHWIESSRGRLYAKRWTPTGEHQGAPVVLLHDSLGCVSTWRDFPHRLAAASGREVIAYDRLGFGESATHPGKLTADFVQDEAKNDFLSVCEQLDVGRFVVMGHSVGAGMAVACAASNPDACEGLVSVSAQAWVDDRIRQGIRAANQQFDSPGAMDRLRAHHGDKAMWVLHAWVDTWLSDAFSTWSLDALLPNIRCPVQVLHGDCDEYGSVQHAEHIAQEVRGPVGLHIVKGCGHVPHRTHPDETLSLIQTFLAKQAQA